MSTDNSGGTIILLRARGDQTRSLEANLLDDGIDATSVAVDAAFRLEAAGAVDVSKVVDCWYSSRAVSAIAQDHIVFIVDDDRRIRESLCELLSTFDLRAVAFGTAAEYIANAKPDVPACLILDVELPDINGLDLQSQIAQGNHPQIVFITGHGDIPASVRAIKAGAIDFLTKPFREEDLLRAVHAGIAQDRAVRRKRADLAELNQRLGNLTPREREVLPLVVSGLLNKQAAAKLGISEITLQIHRSNIMKKMGASSLADLVRIAGTLEIPIAHSRHTER